MCPYTPSKQARSLLALPPKASTAESDIAVPLQQAASKVGADLDPLFQRVRITFKVRLDEVVLISAVHATQEPTSVSTSGIAVAPENTRVLTTHAVKLDGRPLYVPAYDQWDGLGLDYRLDWPVHLLLTPEVVAKYNVLFQYLLRLKRLQMALEDALGALRLARARDPAEHARMRSLWNLRHTMAHVMANLQIYVQADVIEARYGRLLEAVQAARDFGGAERAHREFVDAALLQSLLDLRQIMALLEGIMSLCHRLCVLVQVRIRW